MNTSAVAAASGYSVQQVRNLEACGVLPAAPRAENGYRHFAAVHLQTLHAYRALALAVGPVAARTAMRRLRDLPHDRGAALICAFHAGLNEEREQALAARRALETINAEPAHDTGPTHHTGPADDPMHGTDPADDPMHDTDPADDSADGGDDSMTITELSQALGVRPSTLRFWESAGLVAPQRIATRAGSVRRYHLPAIREARITAALRAAGYRVPDVRRALTAIRDLHDVRDPLAALDARLDAIAHRSLTLLRAGALLADLLTPPAPTTPPGPVA
ncbi:MerR family DNA-binding transcriptional regulator [Streptomyces sp. XM4193]|nr:MerR family DNA-binding transcriptional regulator [Streptomyces sp. XM4193]